MTTYHKCDCCGVAKPHTELEQAVIKIKKCKTCEFKIVPVGTDPRGGYAVDQGNRPIAKPYSAPPPTVASAFNRPPGDMDLNGK